MKLFARIATVNVTLDILLLMSDLVLPGSMCPTNLILAPNVRAAMVEGDLYNICGRIKEIDPNLFIVQLINDQRDCAFMIMEHCADGVDRMVYKTKELDARILHKCEYMRSVPFEHRFKMIEKEIDEEEQRRRDEESERLYEMVGEPMRAEFERCGFTGRRRVFMSGGSRKGRL